MLLKVAPAYEKFQKLGESEIAKKMAGAAGLEPVTSAVTGQRSNQLSYAPVMGNGTIKNVLPAVKILVGKVLSSLKIRAADAKEVGVGNPAEETCCYPNAAMLQAGNKMSMKRFHQWGKWMS
jgi:hypothetical protein